jgi:UDP-N-acetylglucosamine 4-epimerase
LDVYERVKDLMCVDLKKHHVAPRLGDPKKSQADISKAKRVLGYNPKVDFEMGMKLTSEWWLAGCPVQWED